MIFVYIFAGVHIEKLVSFDRHRPDRPIRPRAPFKPMHYNDTVALLVLYVVSGGGQHVSADILSFLLK